MSRIFLQNLASIPKQPSISKHLFHAQARMAAFTVPKTMKVVRQLDPSSTTLTLGVAPMPKPSHPQDCVIKVYTTSPCAGELHWQQWYPGIVSPDAPRIPGTEAAGIIVQTPPNGEAAESAGFKVGDRVFFRIEPTQDGNLREFSLARLSQMAHVPETLGWAEAGSTALSALTAWQGIFQHGILDPRALLGDAAAKRKNEQLSVLITGSSGAVGGWAVYLAALAGAGRIVALCDSSNVKYVEELGATETIDYKQGTVAHWVAKNPAAREVDAAFDCVGGEILASCWFAVKDGGVLLSITGDPGQEKPATANRTLATAKWMLVEPNGKQLQSIADLIARGHKCVTKVDSIVEFADFQAAFDKVEQRKANGKVVIQIADN